MAFCSLPANPEDGIRELVNSEPGEGGGLSRERLGVERPGSEGLWCHRVETVAWKVDRDEQVTGQFEPRLAAPPAPCAMPQAASEDKCGLAVRISEGGDGGNDLRGGTGHRGCESEL